MSKNFIFLKKIEKLINIGFFTSIGGVSKGNYKSLNCNKNSKDYKKNVIKNINIAIKNLGIENKDLKLINQIHSNRIYSITKNNYKTLLYGDGLLTKDKNIALGILTADCAPIFIFDKKNTIICCLHSGWRGASLNIIKESITKMRNKKIEVNDLIAVVGPCLGFKNFEVDKEFKSKFIKKSFSYSKFFRSKNKNKDIFNLRGVINLQLKNEGIKKIYNIKKDTFQNNQKFFSYRRAYRNKMIDTGRMINIISFRD